MNVEMTAKQAAVVDKLEAKGWALHKVSDVGDGPTAYLSKRGKLRGQTWYAEVDADGTVGGHEEAVKVGK